MTRRLTIAAAAKVNPYLAVHGRRQDGFHELRTLLAAISLHDDIAFESTPDGLGRTTLTCNIPTLPIREDNLILRAVQAVREAYPTADDSLAIRLTKRIPWGAGLGGGSADAAATLLALRTLWELPLSPSRLHAIAADLGSDVPFFLGPPLAIGTGRGETLEAVEATQARSLAIVVPRQPLLTPAVFRALALPAPWDTVADRDLAAFGSADSLAKFPFRNDLEAPALRLSSALEGIFAVTRHLLDLDGVHGRLLTGSGSAVVFYTTADLQDELATRLRALEVGQVLCAETLTHVPASAQARHDDAPMP